MAGGLQKTLHKENIVEMYIDIEVHHIVASRSKNAVCLCQFIGEGGAGWPPGRVRPPRVSALRTVEEKC